MLAYLHWNLEPTIVEIGPIALRYYGVCFAAGFLIGYSIIQRIFKQEGKPEKDLDSLCVALVVGTIVGARLGHCLFYHPADYLADPISILKVWEGGLASHGGVIGNLIALWFYARKRPDQPYLWLLDRIVIPDRAGRRAHPDRELLQFGDRRHPDHEAVGRRVRAFTATRGPTGPRAIRPSSTNRSATC